MVSSAPMALSEKQKSAALLVGGVSTLTLLALWFSRTKIAFAAPKPSSVTPLPAPPDGGGPIVVPPPTPNVTTGRTAAGPIYGAGQSILIVGDENAKPIANALYPLLAAKYPSAVPQIVFAQETLATQSIGNLGRTFDPAAVPKTDIALVIAGGYDAEKGAPSKSEVQELALRLLSTTGGHNPSVVFVMPPPKQSVLSTNVQGYVQPYFSETNGAVYGALVALSPHEAVGNWFPSKDTDTIDALHPSPQGVASIATALADFLTKKT